MEQELLTPADVAEILKVEENTLSKWRMQGYGPRHLKLGMSAQSPVRYTRAAVDAYLASLTEGSRR